MATEEELYAKFGRTAEAAQLFETDLGTILLAIEGLENGWLVTPDANAAKVALQSIEAQTLGNLLKRLRGKVEVNDHLEEIFSSALMERNSLNHGWFENHNFKINSAEGRAEMIADLQAKQQKLLLAWKMAQQLAASLTEFVVEWLKKNRNVERPTEGG